MWSPCDQESREASSLFHMQDSSLTFHGPGLPQVDLCSISSLSSATLPAPIGVFENNSQKMPFNLFSFYKEEGKSGGKIVSE